MSATSLLTNTEIAASVDDVCGRQQQSGLLGDKKITRSTERPWGKWWQRASVAAWPLLSYSDLQCGCPQPAWTGHPVI